MVLHLLLTRRRGIDFVMLIWGRSALVCLPWWYWRQWMRGVDSGWHSTWRSHASAEILRRISFGRSSNFATLCDRIEVLRGLTDLLRYRRLTVSGGFALLYFEVFNQIRKFDWLWRWVACLICHKRSYWQFGFRCVRQVGIFGTFKFKTGTKMEATTQRSGFKMFDVWVPTWLQTSSLEGFDEWDPWDCKM